MDEWYDTVSTGGRFVRQDARTATAATTRKIIAQTTPDQQRISYPPGFVLPTRAEAESDPHKFYMLLDFLRNRRTQRLQLNHIKDALGCDQSTAWRKLTERRFSDDERMLIVDYIYARRLIYGTWIEQVHAIPHNLFYAMMDFFNIKESSQDNARGQIVGTYKLYRYSTEFDGECVLGKVEIEEDHKNVRAGHEQDATALRVKIRQVKKPTQFQREGHELLEGYFFRIANMYVMLVKEAITQNLRCTVFKDFRHDIVGTNINPNSIYPANTNHLVDLDGFAMGMDGNLAFFSPVHIELVDDKDHQAARWPPRYYARI